MLLHMILTWSENDQQGELPKTIVFEYVDISSEPPDALLGDCLGIRVVEVGSSAMRV